MKAHFYCDNCGKEVSLSRGKCPSCGQSFIAVRCPECGFEDRPHLFKNGCPICGYLSPQPKTNGIPVAEKKPTPTIPPWVFKVLGVVLAVAILVLLIIFLKI